MFTRTVIKHHAVFCLAAILIFCARFTNAQITINIDENGNGTTVNSAGLQPIPSGNITDPFDPTNGLTPLAYNLNGVLGGVVPTNGDVDVIDSTGLVSDILRFERGLLLVYSDLNEPGDPVSVADVGIPAKQQNLVITMPEIGPDPGLNGLFPYTPTLGDPGYLPIPPGPASYNFTSDVPEPASLGLIALAGILMLCRPRRTA